MRIEKQQRNLCKQIDKLQADLFGCRNSLEVKIMSERILENRVSFWGNNT